MSINFALNKEDLNKSGDFFIGTIIEATDKSIIISYGSKRAGRIVASIFAVILMLIGVFFIVLMTKYAVEGELSDSTWGLIVLYMFAIIFPLMGLFIYKNIQAASKHQVIFNRVDKTITHPQSLISTKHVTQLFKVEDMFVADYQGIFQSGVKVKGIPVFNRFPILRASNKNDIVELWDYIQYYMFHPTLPLGTAFDDYR